MSPDLGYDEEQDALAASVRGFCERRCSAEVVRAEGVPPSLWRGLAELGVLALATPEGGGGALEVAAAMEALGRAGCPGPLVPTFFATQVLGERDRTAVGAGDTVVSVGAPPLMPWGAVADVLIEVAAGRAWTCRRAGAARPVATLGREPWARVEVVRDRELPGVSGAASLADAAMAAYLAGAGRSLLDLSAAYAADRIQFRKPIGDFQAVAHPLADAEVGVTSATYLARVAAFDWDRGDLRADASAAEARLSATRAALGAAYRAHQTLGAIGFTEEGPVGWVSARIRQVSMLPTGSGDAREAVLRRHDL